MSGRGKPGGGLVSHHEPEDIKVTLSLLTTTSANTFPLEIPGSSSKDEAINSSPQPFYIQIHASVKFSTHPTLPVTLATWRTPLERNRHPAPSTSRQDSANAEDGEEGEAVTSPVWINSALTPLRSTTHPSKYAAPPALGYVVHRRGGYERDLRNSWDFVTLPPASHRSQGDDKAEVVIRHLLPREGLQFFSKTGGKEDVQPKKGEKFVIGPSAGGLGTFWWRWGDLSGDLAGKKFRADDWWDGKGEGDEVLEGEWVESEGKNGFGLTMEVENEAEIEFVYE